MEMMCANSTMTANFATSEGCRLPPMGRNIHRFAPFSSGMKSTTMSSTTVTAMMGHANLWKMW